MDRYLCAAASLSRAEPMFATASRVSRWVLLEQPGPWGSEAPPTSRLDAAVFDDVHRRARAAGARLLLIRRPEARRRVQEDRHVFVADSRPGHERALRTTVRDEAELGALTLPFDEEPADGWQPAPEPLFLVCTHGKHDPCCAMLGRPVASVLAASHPENTWETSHVGGDRFAANVVVLPWGLYLGRVDPTGADRIAALVCEGRLPRAHYRGRSTFATPVQAAQHFAAVCADVTADRIGDLAPLQVQRLAPEQWRVTLAAGDGEAVVELERVTPEETWQLTCHSEREHTFPAFRLLGPVKTG